MPTTTAQRRAHESTPRQTAASRRRAQQMRAAPPKPAGDEWLTVEEVCVELKIGRRTFERWRALGIAPRASRPTGNGPLRIRRSWLDDWMEANA